MKVKVSAAPEINLVVVNEVQLTADKPKNRQTQLIFKMAPRENKIRPKMKICKIGN